MTRGPARAEGLPDGVKTFAVFNHLAGLGGLITGGLPFVSALAVTALWLFKRRDSPFIDDHGAEAVNFQCSLLLYTLLAFLGALLFTILTLGIGAFIWVFTPVFFVVMSVVNAIGCIRGAIFAGSGKYYRYPITVRFIHR